jgi:hypothetical protein
MLHHLIVVKKSGFKVKSPKLNFFLFVFIVILGSQLSMEHAMKNPRIVKLIPHQTKLPKEIPLLFHLNMLHSDKLMLEKLECAKINVQLNVKPVTQLTKIVLPVPEIENPHFVFVQTIPLKPG